jgi:hypothetical protein
MLRGGHSPFVREISKIRTNKNGQAPTTHPQPPLMMNPPKLDDDPLKIHEAVIATAYVAAACAGLAMCFAILAACEAGKGVIERFSRKGVRRVP